MSAGGRTVWGDPEDIEKVLEGAAFDTVLDNNGKDLDAVRFAYLFQFLIMNTLKYRSNQIQISDE